MSLTIGRVGLTGLLGEPSSIDYQGDDVTFSGTIKNLSAAAWTMLRDQFRGLTGPDEPVVPITSSNDSTLNGFYSIVSVHVPHDPNGLHGGWFQWSVQATRVPDSALPQVESLLVGGYRAFAASLGTPIATSGVEPWWSMPTAQIDSSVTLIQEGVTADDGTTLSTAIAPFGTGILTGSAQWHLPPTSWYLASARIEQSVDSGFLPVMGRFASSATFAQVSNGVLRVSPASGGITVSFWKGAAWSTPKQFNFVFGTGSFTRLTFVSATVTINTPAVVGLTMVFTMFATLLQPGLTITIDVILRRGATWAEIVINDGSGNGWKHGLSRSSNEAGTNINGGIRATATDGDGLEYIMLAGAAYTTNTTVGSLTDNVGVAAFPMAIGMITTGNTLAAADVIKRYYGPYGEHVSFAR